MKSRTYLVEPATGKPVRFTTPWKVTYNIEHRTVHVHDHDGMRLIGAFTDVVRAYELDDDRICFGEETA